MKNIYNRLFSTLTNVQKFDWIIFFSLNSKKI